MTHLQMLHLKVHSERGMDHGHHVDMGSTSPNQNVLSLQIVENSLILDHKICEQQVIMDVYNSDWY